MLTESPDIQHVPLDALQLSPENVATTDRDDVADLVADIRAHGLLQNLIVQDDGSGQLLVKAGGRRLRALQQLAEAGEWSQAVPVNVLPAGANVTEISLAENIQRKDMHPVDEFAAFKKLIESEGLTSDDIAARFGKSKLYVDQRLRLANVSPKILDLLKRGGIGLGQVMALSITDDHAAQENVWKGAQRSDWAQSPENLRESLTTAELSVADNDVARYLGVRGYEAGGGVPRVDLFGDEHDAWLPDAKLARTLAEAKLEKYADKIRAEGWAWVEVRLDFSYADESKFGVFGKKNSWDYVDTSKKQWPAEAKAIAGAVVSIGRKGPEVDRGLIRPQDVAKINAEAKKAGKAAPATGKKPKPAKKPGQLSFAAVQRLQGERTAVLRKVLSTDPRRALAALAADLAEDQGLTRGGGRGSHQAVVQISGDRQFSAPVQAREVIEHHPYTKDMDAAEKEWHLRLEPGKGRLFAWLLEQPESLVLELLAFCSARTIMAVEVSESNKDRGASFAVTAGVDMHDHWKPTEAWLSEQPKPYVLEAVSEALGKKSAVELQKLKKGPLAERAAALLASTDWIPKELRAPAPPKREKKARATGKAAAAGE